VQVGQAGAISAEMMDVSAEIAALFAKKRINDP
jgi:hypothetical protein